MNDKNIGVCRESGFAAEKKESAARFQKHSYLIGSGTNSAASVTNIVEIVGFDAMES
jgi:hypothetical protein